MTGGASSLENYASIAKSVLDVAHMVTPGVHRLLDWWNSSPNSSSGKKVRRSGKGSASTGNSIRNEFKSSHGSIANSFKAANPVYHQITANPLGGKPGDIRVTGRQYLCAISTNVGDYSPFGNGGADYIAYSVPVSPDTFNQRVAAIATLFEQYCFRHIRFNYMPSCATTQSGNVAFGYSADPLLKALAGNPGYSQIMQITPSILVPFREADSLEMIAADPLERYWTENNTTDKADSRQTIQGQLLGSYNAGNYALIMGDMWVEFVIDLYDPSYSYGFSIIAKTREERKYLLRCADDYRARHEPREVPEVEDDNKSVVSLPSSLGRGRKP